MNNVIIATAGHVDHGKTSLIKSLSNQDTDRLPEEKKRKLTIDLGFAEMKLGENQIGFIDVPGHQDFIKNMVSGFCAVDLILMVVSADDGWMPQTEEHLQIISYLGVKKGIVVLTKTDLIKETSLKINSIRKKIDNSVLANSEIIPFSSKTGDGLNNLKESILSALKTLPERKKESPTRISVDRSFSLKGMGTVITGTLTGDPLLINESIGVYPPGKTSRIKALHNHNQSSDRLTSGLRAAVNLTDIPYSEIKRGAVLARPEYLIPVLTLEIILEYSSRFDSDSKSLKTNTIVRIHHGTANTEARIILLDTKKIIPGERALAQLRLSNPISIWLSDRILIRNWQGNKTLAGGFVLNIGNEKKQITESTKKTLKIKTRFPDSAIIWAYAQTELEKMVKLDHIIRPSNFTQKERSQAISHLVKKNKIHLFGEWVLSNKFWNTLVEKVSKYVDKIHFENPTSSGMPEERITKLINHKFNSEQLEELLRELCFQYNFIRHGGYIARKDHNRNQSDNLRDEKEQIHLAMKEYGFITNTQLIDDDLSKHALRFLIKSGNILSINDEIYMSAMKYGSCKLAAKMHLRGHGKATVSELKKVMNTSRKVAVPVLEKMDKDGITTRQGDYRVLFKE
ncbi:selenocysteine-specific translation elongation factor [Verrucomicrobia bacterium]|nr:selenocysteine-specific translation elongation factor [Verrucomicrobiota bacterium]